MTEFNSIFVSYSIIEIVSFNVINFKCLDGNRMFIIVRTN